MYLVICLVLTLLLIYYLLKYYEKKHNYWRNLNIDTPKYYYFVGNILDQFLYRRNVGTIITDAYNEFKDYNYFGFYNSTIPALVIRNPEIIEEILVKDFSCFHDNDIDVAADDLLMGKNPFLLNGDEWKTVRTQISPCFTTYKTKLLLPKLHDASKKLLEYLKTFPPIKINAKDLSTQITTENVALSVVGIESGSFNKQPTKNAAKSAKMTNFYTETQRLLNTTFNERLLNFLTFIFPFLQRILPKNDKTEEIVSYLNSIIQNFIENREETENKHFLHFLLERMDNINKIKKEEEFKMADVLSHASGFIIDGIETSSIVLTHSLYELGRNSLIQDRIREEINDAKRNVSSKFNITYEMIEKMQVLDCFLKEVIRLHPPFFMLMKRVTRSYTLRTMREDNSGTCLTLPIGMSILLPLEAIHLDAKYFDAPKDFKPERFLDGGVRRDELKFTFLPFGEGPRKCLGMKFGVLQTKLAIISLVEHYEIRVNSKTKRSGCDPGSFVNLPKDGYWIDLIPVGLI